MTQLIHLYPMNTDLTYVPIQLLQFQCRWYGCSYFLKCNDTKLYFQTNISRKALPFKPNCTNGWNDTGYDVNTKLRYTLAVRYFFNFLNMGIITDLFGKYFSYSDSTSSNEMLDPDSSSILFLARMESLFSFASTKCQALCTVSSRENPSFVQ